MEEPITIERTRMDQVQPLYCSVCKKNMRNGEHGGSYVGISITLDTDGMLVDAAGAEKVRVFYKEQLGVYSDMLEVGSSLKLDICWECWFKSLGVPIPHKGE